ncbi:hypothetical protein MRX96_020306 [Rhipicephalus microplus]
MKVRKTTNWRARSPLWGGAGRGIIVFLFPKNVNPEKDRERRKARAAALDKQYKSDDNAAFVDVATKYIEKMSVRDCSHVGVNG